MRHPYDFNPPPIRTQMRGTVTQREEWWHIRCWLKPRLFAIGVNNKQWHRYKRRLQQYLRDNGYEPTVREAELLLHQLRTEKKKKITPTAGGDNPGRPSPQSRPTAPHHVEGKPPRVRER
jgi:hypothetical protein